MRKSLQDYNVSPSHRIDADAVCVQCGTVNPEGTLICKSCGNNLRDQKRIRMQAEEELKIGEELPSPRNIMLGVITVVGAIIVVIAGFNADRIMLWLVGASEVVYSSEGMWTGSLGRQLNSLTQDLKNQMIASSRIYSAIKNPINSNEIEGLYVVAVSDADNNFVPVGKAILKSYTDNEYLFSALLDNGAQIRGVARKQEHRLIASWDRASCEWGDVRGAVSGIVTKREDGRYEGYGGYEKGNANFEFYAFKLP
ncbi:MAG: hypothetical protein N3G21_04525 [Candidatus Hydrogenedentes bacterium]|nr:hypothetical protein [Candidatus Hydrogenedentota bacterium]